jgi:hypothetical protein
MNRFLMGVVLANLICLGGVDGLIAGPGGARQGWTGGNRPGARSRPQPVSRFASQQWNRGTGRMLSSVSSPARLSAAAGYRVVPAAVSKPTAGAALAPSSNKSRPGSAAVQSGLARPGGAPAAHSFYALTTADNAKLSFLADKLPPGTLQDSLRAVLQGKSLSGGQRAALAQLLKLPSIPADYKAALADALQTDRSNKRAQAALRSGNRTGLGKARDGSGGGSQDGNDSACSSGDQSSGGGAGDSSGSSGGGSANGSGEVTPLGSDGGQVGPASTYPSDAPQAAASGLPSVNGQQENSAADQDTPEMVQHVSRYLQVRNNTPEKVKGYDRKSWIVG